MFTVCAAWLSDFAFFSVLLLRVNTRCFTVCAAWLSGFAFLQCVTAGKLIADVHSVSWLAVRCCFLQCDIASSLYQKCTVSYCFFTVCYSWGVNSGCSQCLLAGRQIMLFAVFYSWESIAYVYSVSWLAVRC
jgi:hypothetical protein